MASDCELYNHPLVDGYKCPCGEKTHPKRTGVLDPLPYPVPLPPPVFHEATLSIESNRLHRAESAPNYVPNRKLKPKPKPERIVYP